MKICIQNLFVAVVVFIGLHHAAAQVSFAPVTNYSVGNALPVCVTAADINGDGKVDLISSPLSGHTLTVFTNNGNGIFGSNATYSAGSAGSFPYVATDVNEDGHVDFISIGLNGSLVVLTNNRSGVLVSNASYAIGKYPISGGTPVVAADVNGDGKVDLIGVSYQDNILTVLTNNGNGVFGSNATYVVGQEPISVVAADINGDGKVDLITSNYKDNTLTVLTNNGSGGFGLNATLDVGGSPQPLVATDINGDGKPDLISGSADTPGGLTVWTNNGNGIFGFNATYTVQAQVFSIAAADINGDGKVALICAINPMNPGLPGQLLILTNNGSGTFGSNTTINLGSFWVAAADVNGDGKIDLITANMFSNSLSVLINTSTFPPPSSTPALNINSLGNGMLVSWPSVSAGWSLQQNSDLTTSNWSPSGYSGYTISDDGTNKSLIISPATGNLFFRLLHP